MEKRRYIRRMLRMAALAVGMVLTGGASAWGQRDLPNRYQNYDSDYDFCYNRPNNRIVNQTEPAGMSEVTETLYVMPGESVEIALQFWRVADNLNGYVRWYLEDENGTHDGTTTNLSRATSGTLGLVEYENGFAWFRHTHTTSGWGGGATYTNLADADGPVTPLQICYITYNCPSNYTDGDVVVCEASSLTDFGEPITGFNNANATREAPTLSIRKRYIIKSATSIQTTLSGYRTAITGIAGGSGSTSGNNWIADDNYNNNETALPSAIINNPSQYFKESYTIHTPIWNEGQGTTYRLDEAMSSYYVPGYDNPATQVRWRTYDASGNHIDTEIKNVPTQNHAETESGWADLFNHPFTLDNTTTTQTRYITAEVRYSSGYNESDWYPVSFQKVLLEPNMVPMTQNELEKDNTYASERRLLSSLSDPNRYEQLGQTISFDESVISFGDLDEDNNVAEKPYSADTYYAFAFPARWNERGGQMRTAGRGEYGLYRTLNYTGVSEAENGNSQYHYKDYFAWNNYNVWAADRTYDLTGGSQIGHFFYVDAADEPGVIASIDLNNVTLCPSTSLIVTAWVCNLLHRSGNPDGADIGITFIGISEDGTTETILDKYYSGELTRKTSEDGTQAQWQQIYFNFTTDVQYPRYRVEISNNSPSSNGADYGIDDIRIYRSLPDITVARQDACESSQLYVSSDYQTILNNMGWYLDADVLEITPGIDIENDFEARKYRYGFLTNNIVLNPTRVGNVYFGVLDGEKYDAGQVEWVVVNNRLKDSDNPQVARLANVIRAVVPTNLSNEFERFPDNEARAQAMEVEINIQAMRDYNSDIEAGKFSDRISTPIELGELANIELNDGAQVLNNSTLLALYEEKVQELYTILQIPRIHIPWKEIEVNGEDGTETVTDIYLAQIDVNNTDMKYMDELDPNGGEPASGYYKVYLFSAAQIVNNVDVDPADECALVSSFWVYPSIVIKVDTETAQNDVLCQNSIHTIDAQLVTPKLDENGYPTGEVVELTAVDYNFDWFLGSEDDYNNINGDNGRDLKAIITDFREHSTDSNIQHGGSFDDEDVEDSNLSELEKSVLMGLLAAPTKLISGKNIEFQLTGQIVAMPYVYNGNVDQTHRLYCTELQTVDLESNPNVPELAPGFPEVSYATVRLTNVPLRIGLTNIKNQTQLTNIPIQKEIIYGVKDATDNVLKPLSYNKNILLDVGGSYQVVATLNSLIAQNGASTNKMTMTFNDGAEQYFAEGEEYDLLVPFGEYANESDQDVINGSCEGYAHLLIKIVPEYLTWKGTGSDDWYDESKWNQSTKGELYFDGSASTDANGSDEDLTKAFSPLYFTKITIPESSELALENAQVGSDGKTLNITTTENIQYDMAVADANGTIAPYYINKVEQIYFKPKALLKKQQILTYQKAWVEFEMGKGDANWLASPLKDVFAGDMYAPKGTGRQTTPAFTDIKYTDTNPDYDRWNPTFYQKAWDKGITYYTKEDGSTSETTTVVKSNWSIEYNDVNVPYALGKGFYASTNDFENTETDESGKQQALVRLPKADASYSYVTKTASTIANRPNAGELAGSDPVKIILTDADTQDDWYGEGDVAYADGDGTHFLIGNPYMYPLDITKFFNGNKKDGDTDLFARKYWVLENGTTAAAVVGTPDVGFGANTGAITNLGQIAPMQAFFVELATPLSEGGSVEIQFTTDMMADAATTQSLDTRSYEATNPQLILTASSKQGKSVSVVTKRSDASNQYESDKDAVTLLDSELDAPTVYTVAGNYAAAVNAIHDYKNVPLGVYADVDEEVELTIEGASQLVEPLYLYDAVTRSTTPIEGDSYTLNLQGSSHGRYFLTTDEGITVESDIRIYSPADGQLIIASTPSDKLKHVQVYDLSGRVVDSRQNIGMTTCQISVPGGIYIIRAESEHGEAQAKLKVR